MYKRCTTEKAALQQRKIEECLLSLMQNKALGEISVSSLCDQTGLSRKTFYRLYESKHDVLCALIDRAIRDYIHFHLPSEVLSPDTSAELQTFFAYWLEQRPLLDALSNNGISTLLFDQCIRHTLEEDRNILLQLGLVHARQQQDVESLMFFLSGILTLVVGWHHMGYQKTVQEMAEITERLLTAPPSISLQ